MAERQAPSIWVRIFGLILGAAGGANWIGPYRFHVVPPMSAKSLEIIAGAALAVWASFEIGTRCTRKLIVIPGSLWLVLIILWLEPLSIVAMNLDAPRNWAEDLKLAVSIFLLAWAISLTPREAWLNDRSQTAAMRWICRVLAGFVLVEVVIVLVFWRMRMGR